MFRPVELFVGLRYTRARRRGPFISFISMTSMVGIALGVAALITVLSVMNGFEQELRERILGMVSHAEIHGPGEALPDWQGALERAERHPRVAGAAPFIDSEVMVTRGGQVSGTLVRGVHPEHEREVSEVLDHIVAGDARLAAGEYNLILGSALARSLGARVGDRVVVVTPQARVSVAGITPRLRRFTVTGIFEVGMHEYDRALAVAHLEDMARLSGLGDAVSGIRLRFDDLFAAPRLARQVADELPGYYRVTDWTQQHANFFRAVQTEKTVMFVILALIVAVAAFNIVSTLVMVVRDKQADIAILRTLGLPPRSIMAVFIIQGALIGAVGTALGAAGGVALALNVETVVPALEQLLNVEFLPADVYYISDLPAELRGLDVVRVTGLALALSLVATLYPAWRGARTEPAEALRYE
ncbi:lipoprotein-releasing ABC transporter permease subunit [Halorhodospira neutriphila]|uniref:Lipoprotein-releasing system transmembrane subunit LolC n=1 Tax=Halorhodospira neutriphila TaxID=168379 RepID=A0ABS1E5H5_9GAMM|nr:lipoprotein-releasing ABC transporter permease subunit [Halorhodospira neutriphila]MBK1726755.1 lipoprotein-releasing system transmembrane subunit LolC [Halorhodospira neutriphila]